MTKTKTILLISFIAGVFWIATFLLPLTIDTPYNLFSTIFAVRVVSFLIGFTTFLTVIILALKKYKFSKSILIKIQVTSIIAASIDTIISLLYDHLNVDYITLSNLGYISFTSGIIAIILFILSVIIIIQNKSINKLLIINLLIIIYPLFWTIVLFFLIGIGFGPPS